MNKRLRLASEEYCYVTHDSSSEETRWSYNEKMRKHINLFDDEYVVLDQIRYKATEVLFEKEELSTSRKKGTLVDAIIESVQKCDINLAKNMYGNILLTGGGAFYKGLEKRLTTELRTKIPKHIEFKINMKQNRLISSWIGGSILSTLKTFPNLWVTKEEYEAKGASAVDRCL
jgi:actin-related protein